MAKRKRGDVAIEEKRELEASVPVETFHEEAQPVEGMTPTEAKMTADYAKAVAELIDPIAAEIAAKPPLVYLRQPELREAWVDILAHRALQIPIPEHLAINDNLTFTNRRAAEGVLTAMARESVELTPENVRIFADKAIPKA